MFTRLAEITRHSLVAKGLKTTMARESAFEHSVVFRMINAVLKVLDKGMMKFSTALSKWSEASLIIRCLRTIAKASKERRFALLFPVFGIGYLAGRMLQGKLMIRDVFLLGLMFIAAGIVLSDSEKRKAIWKNSLAYQLVILILE